MLAYITMETISMETLAHKDTLTASSLYEVDFYQWAFHNADLLRQGRLTEIDIENIVEELESMGRSDKREIANRLELLIMHLLKWQYQPQRRSESWTTTIGNQRVAIAHLLEDSPSLKYNMKTVIDKEFITSKRRFEKETGMSARALPKTCLYTFEQLMDHDFWPE
ncbi:protein containing DUF29 [Candidatus Magnetobacterium bavaricum]|uniref:Protein containing DUF29 n=1 Tax=Candidatus Magnetobacterium bavaricum TaxID=29290 RepID=A0A0F3H0S6_9BACT|nr:protein containing DUF29 [Candidatus Magnetobacterium bavaricum]